MTKRQKEILQSQLDREKQILDDLSDYYLSALTEVNNTIAQLRGRTDIQNLQSIMYQVQYQEALKKQINGILDVLNSKEFTSIANYLRTSYEDGFTSVMYDLHGQGVPIIFPIDQKQVVKAIENDTKLAKGLYKSIGEDIDKLKIQITDSITRGIIIGESYANMARNIEYHMVGNYHRVGGSLAKAYTIARTEGHRIQNEAADDARHIAKSKGANIVKQWDSTLDGRTRPSHRKVDGEIVDIDDKFSNGLLYPGDPDGIAAEVVNCRCACLQRAKWALDTDELQKLKDRAKYFGLDKTESFEDFEKKYLGISDK